MASSTLTVNGTSSRASSSTSELRQRYNAASRAFLVRDFASTASALQQGLQLAPTPTPEAWFTAVVNGQPIPADVDLRRRLEILQVTLLATVRSSASPAISSLSNLDPLLQLLPSRLIKALWDTLITPASPDAAAEKSDDSDAILPTPSAAFLHPSLAVALVLAALKLDEPRAARQVAEAWFGSVDAEVERVVWETAATLDLGEEFPLDAVGSGSGSSSGGAGGMSGSSILGAANSAAAPAGRSKADEAKKALVGGWLKLLDLLVLHVLPKLGEWEAAGDFVRLQGVENGGWVPDERVEAALHRLDDLQREEVHSAALRAERQKELDAARAGKKRDTRTNGRGSTGAVKSKARETSPATTSSSSGSSPGASPKKGRRGTGGSKGSTPSTSAGQTPRSSPPLAQNGASTGLGGLRSSLPSYLGGASSSSSNSSSSTTSPRPASPISSFISYLHYQYASDPLRILSVFVFLFAFSTWARRRLVSRRARGESGLGLASVLRVAVGKVGETVRMATKVTAL
ncbi:hypothetical protein JCM8097_007337 [Rhodosporidiobolus ruineniae]